MSAKHQQAKIEIEHARKTLAAICHIDTDAASETRALLCDEIRRLEASRRLCPPVLPEAERGER